MRRSGTLLRRQLLVRRGVQMAKRKHRQNLKIIKGGKPPKQSEVREELPAVSGSSHGQREIPTEAKFVTAVFFWPFDVMRFWMRQAART